MLTAAIHTVTIDESLRVQLRDLTEVTVVCDAAGNRIGHFMPLTVPTEILDGLRTCPYSEAELRQFAQETGGKPLSEILKSLERSA
jgi:hypothetical protein